MQRKSDKTRKMLDSYNMRPWMSQVRTIGIVPFNLRHCLISSLLLPALTLNESRELASVSTFGSDLMAGQERIDRCCSELGRPSLGSDRRASQPTMDNFLSLSSLCSPAGRYCILPHLSNSRSWREVRRRSASTCSIVKRSTSSLDARLKVAREEETRLQKESVRTPAMSSLVNSCSLEEQGRGSSSHVRDGLEQSTRNLGLLWTSSSVS